ncbi:hypothetical protein PUR56_14430, partial [Streptomyces sp. BE303]|nr:hypothetical protein [Streptomyces sp. BE303]
FLAGTGLMFTQDWRLALIAHVPVVPLFLLTRLPIPKPHPPPHTPHQHPGIDQHNPTRETKAQVGATRSGKTTHTAILPRLNEATGGTITLDGRDSREHDRTR